MKVRIGTWEISTELRRAIRHQKGMKGLATRDEVRLDINGHMGAIWTDYILEYRAATPDTREE